MVAIPLKSFWFVGVKAKYFHPTIPRKDIYLLVLVAKNLDFENIYRIS